MGDGPIPVFSDDYYAVALVEADSLYEARKLTEHNGGNWTQNKGVRLLRLPIIDGIVPKSLRSTKLGDLILELDRDDGNHLWFVDVCAMFRAKWVGYRPILITNFEYHMGYRPEDFGVSRST